jgi:hypothetical protein
MKKSDAEIDYKLAPFDTKRFFEKEFEVEARKGI